MSKLLKFKEWLTVEDAAKRLSISAGEDVTEADILRLALGGHLTMSVYFVNHARGRPARIEPIGVSPAQKEVEAFLAEHSSALPGSPNEAKKWLSDFVQSCRGELLPNGKEVLILEGDGQRPARLEGVWDLLMLGAEALDVEHVYQNLTAGPAVELICLGGPLVASADRSQIFQILNSYKRSTRPPEDMPPSIRPKPQISKEMREAMDRLNAMIGPVTASLPKEEEPARWDYETVYYPAEGLPEDSIFVVRTSALRELEERLLADEAQPEKPLHPSERRSAGQIITTLAAMAGLDLSAPYAADETLRAAAATLGLELPSSPETVVKFLKDAAVRANKA